jgi:hypothetical protein
VCVLTQSGNDFGNSEWVNPTRQQPDHGTAHGTAHRHHGLPSIRIGIAAGITGLLCCVGPTVLALMGVVSAGTAFMWANDLYDGYSWAFRLSGLALLTGLAWWALRRRNQCSLGGIRDNWQRLLLAAGVAVGTYAALYALTTWLGTFA